MDIVEREYIVVIILFLYFCLQFNLAGTAAYFAQIILKRIAIKIIILYYSQLILIFCTIFFLIHS